MSEQDTINTIVANVSASQALYLDANDKYEHTSPETLDGITYYCHEYVDPDGVAGYQLFFERDNGGTIEVMSIGYGPQADDRTFDWQAKP